MNTLGHMFSAEVELPGVRNRCRMMRKWNFCSLGVGWSPKTPDLLMSDTIRRGSDELTKGPRKGRISFPCLSRLGSPDVTYGSPSQVRLILTPSVKRQWSSAHLFSREDLLWEVQSHDILQLLQCQDFPQHPSHRAALAWPFLPNEELINGQWFCQNIPLGVPRGFQIYTTVRGFSLAISFSALFL